MKRLAALLLAVLSLALGGCANFRVVGDFAQATKEVTGPIRDELAFITATCVRQAELRSGLEMDDEFARIAQCRGTDRVLQALQRETVNVIDLYASALLALVDDRKYDVSDDIDKAGRKLAALKTRNDAALVTTSQARAVAGVLDLVADAWLRQSREDGIRTLVAAAPEVAALGRSLDRFFTVPEGPSPYAELVRLTQAEARAVDALLRSEVVLRSEPLRAAELRLAQWKLRQALRQRAATDGSSVGALLSQSLRAWVDSVPEFATDALKADPQALRLRLKQLREKAQAASDAAADAAP